MKSTIGAGIGVALLACARPALPVAAPPTARLPICADRREAARETPLDDPSARLPPRLIQEIVRGSHGTFRRCYERGLRARSGLHARVSTRFTIGLDGAVTCAGASAGKDTPPEMTACVVDVFSSLRFPPPDGGAVVVVYPIQFSPGDGSEPPETLIETCRRDPEACAARCRSGDAAECADLGARFRDGRGVRRDRVRSVYLLHHACAGGDASACNGLGYAYALGAGVPIDALVAMKLFLRACGARSSAGCDSVGEAHERGWGTAPSPVEAIGWYEMACRMGSSASCANAERLRTRR